MYPACVLVLVLGLRLGEAQLDGPAHGQGSEVEPSRTAPAHGFTASAVDQRPLGQVPQTASGQAQIVLWSWTTRAVKVRDRRYDLHSSKNHIWLCPAHLPHTAIRVPGPEDPWFVTSRSFLQWGTHKRQDCVTASSSHTSHSNGDSCRRAPSSFLGSRLVLRYVPVPTFRRVHPGPIRLSCHIWVSLSFKGFPTAWTVPPSSVISI